MSNYSISYIFYLGDKQCFGRTVCYDVPQINAEVLKNMEVQLADELSKEYGGKVKTFIIDITKLTDEKATYRINFMFYWHSKLCFRKKIFKDTEITSDSLKKMEDDYGQYLAVKYRIKTPIIINIIKLE